ncbi:uncharacterized protein LOC124788437 [Schistocerca piceifrons]|uniref:uncharacterized protein LOC124788437 n=1 Tax=Schistocerca piceifrons TaxID=274613 RepID=UPI001F5F9399|nr:uncharacterized protein LOC124788437 [Schistocerca piceifrons]
METDPEPAPPPPKKKLAVRISKDLEGLLALAASKKVEAATKENAALVSNEEKKKAVSQQTSKPYHETPGTISPPSSRGGPRSPSHNAAALSAPLPDSEDESSTAPQPRGRSGKQKRRATAATSAVRSSPIEKRAKQDFAPDADGFVPARRTARRVQSSTTLPTAVANSFDALADAPDQLPRDPAPKKDCHLPPVVLQFRPPYGELQKLLRSWTTAVYTVKPAGRDPYRVTLRTADDYRRVTQEASERVIVDVRCGSVPSPANVDTHQRHVRRSRRRDGPASLSRRQRQGRPPPSRLRRLLLPLPHPRPCRHLRLLRLHHSC